MELDKQALDNWITREQDLGDEYDEERPYVAHIESYDRDGNLTNIRHEDIGEWERLMAVTPEGAPVLSHITHHFADGSTFIVSRDHGPFGDGTLAGEHRHEDDVQFVALCPQCLEPVDYCLGHGELG